MTVMIIFWICLRNIMRLSNSNAVTIGINHCEKEMIMIEPQDITL